MQRVQLGMGAGPFSLSRREEPAFIPGGPLTADATAVDDLQTKLLSHFLHSGVLAVDGRFQEADSASTFCFSAHTVLQSCIAHGFYFVLKVCNN